MSIEIGTKFQISKGIKGYYNSAETMTIIRTNGTTVQFTLEDGKGHGSMPLQHFQYLLKRTELTKIHDKMHLINNQESEQDIS